ncbi:hypothetical protein EUGRSUZ_L02621 [Eucalyptus grandis]|uniref:Uncharacterized protein n=1 Tax=Eucalyptus grandis TaxID=71139 RepID=A0AAD9T8R2_EUCGR|nr:hypothetical protein EUGRSUZ_L02621 [Eucalyptus grandis]
MASHDKSFRAGETKGREDGPSDGGRERQGRGSQGQDYDTAQAAKDKTHESKDQSGSYISEKAGAAKQKASETAEATKEKASRAAEQVKSMAQGAKESVKHTFGMAGDEDQDRDDPPRYT